ncbi:hypothetical protein C8A03DRAFT_46246 [Achaetomium macrosporum]|uniref:Uncharacterized protein n=1 Tax=Achaetomium macrosporum TaxID=79813 RepID=A0AAN7C6G4_9PEZI|nr:hypothetical protein C8A03DRAFT_46246 [Achaetomium macrosporum]
MARTTEDLGRLREQRDTDSTQTPDEQMMQSFARFLKLPRSERLVGIHACANAFPFSAMVTAYAGFFPPDKERTYCGDFLFSDPARYDYGDSWQRIFCRMPQLLEPSDPENYEADCAAELAQARGEDCLDDGGAKEQDGESTEASLGLRDRYHYYHLACKAGVICVVDVETPLTQRMWEELRPSERPLLVAWYNADGKTVRSCWMSVGEVCQHAHQLTSSSALDDHAVWNEAKVGGDYDWDIEEKGGEDEEEVEGGDMGW